MSLIGQNIAHYTITQEIGRGGMGEVYRATDTKLKRDVALKVLPESFTQDAQRVSRFRREAEVLASLNHPNIGSIHGLEETDTSQVLVLELIEGEDLADRIARGPIPLDEALRITFQIAEALEAAHGKGIIHRDLKPANIKITPEGQVKVLDFGLAKSVERDSAVSSPGLTHSPTLTLQATQAGIILGTAPYMSPEQARGLPADHRSDIWSFGVVLFEMLTGRQAFSGSDVTEVLASVVKVDLDWDALPTDVHPSLRRWLQRCLEADPRERCHSMADLRLVIRDVLDAPTLVPEEGRKGRGSLWTRPILLGGALLLAGLAFVTAWFAKPTPAPDLPVVRITIPDARNRPAPPVLSPDGKILVYTLGNALWIRHLDRFYPEEMPDSRGVFHAFFSPDSRFLGYQQGDKLWKMDLTSGVKSPLADVPNIVGGTWGEDGTIVYGTRLRENSGLYQVSAQGGVPQLLLKISEPRDTFSAPHFLPGQRGILFFRRRSRSIELLADGQRRTLLSEESAVGGFQFSSVVYSPSGHLVYTRQGEGAGLFAVPFSLSSLALTGEPFLIDPAGRNPSVSQDQTLSYFRTFSGGKRQLLVRDRQGQNEVWLGRIQHDLDGPAVSPDGRWVATSGGEQDGAAEIWLHDIERGSARKLSSPGDARDFHPTWSPSGKEVAFWRRSESGPEIWMRPADLSSEAWRVTKGASPHFSADGRYLVFDTSSRDSSSQRDIWYLELDKDSEPQPFLQTDADEFEPRVSPNSRYIAYASRIDSTESIPRQVYVKRFPSGDGLWQISTDGGDHPRWSPNGDELFYRWGRPGAQSLMVVPVQATASFDHGAPRELPGVGFMGTGFSLAEGGAKIVTTSRSRGQEGRESSIAIVRNWFEEFRQK